MKQNVSIKEKLTVYIYDTEGNLIKKEVIKPPKNKLEEIAARLGILKRANSVNFTGLNIMAKLWGGEAADPIKWISALQSDDTWVFKSSVATVYSRNVVVGNPDSVWVHMFPDESYIGIGAATSNHEDWIVSSIEFLDIIIGGGWFWAEIEYDFTQT